MRIASRLNFLFSLITPKDLTKGVKISTIVHLSLLLLCVIGPLIIPHHRYKSFRPTTYTVQLVSLPGAKLQQASTIPKPVVPVPKIQEPVKEQKTETKPKEPIVQKKPEMVIPKKGQIKTFKPKEKTPDLAEKLSKRFKEFDIKTSSASQKDWTEPVNTVPVISGSLGSSGTLGISTPSDFPFQWYLELIHSKISSCWTSPQMTLDKRYSAIISFTITKTGEITNINIKRSSEISNFDQSGIKAIELAKPFPELPPGFQYSQLTVNVEFALE